MLTIKTETKSETINKTNLDNVFVAIKRAKNSCSFVVLEKAKNDYIQAKFDGKKWRLEYREPQGTNAYKHFYARPVNNAESKLIEETEIIQDSFLAFLLSGFWPKSIIWVRYNI